MIKRRNKLKKTKKIKKIKKKKKRDPTFKKLKRRIIKKRKAMGKEKRK